MVTSTIQKDIGLDKLFDGYDSGSVEERSSIEVLGSGNLEKALRKIFTQGLIKSDQLKTEEPLVLTPNEISILIEKRVEYEKSMDIIGPFGTSYSGVGIYLGWLIQNSYNEGYNSFFLDLKELPLHNLCVGITGDDNQPIDLIVKGDLKSSFLYNSSNVNARIEGNVDQRCGYLAKNVSLVVDGDVYREFFSNSKDCKLTVNGTIKNSFLENSQNVDLTLDNVSDLSFFKMDVSSSLLTLNKTKDSNISVSNFGSFSYLKKYIRREQLNGVPFTRLFPRTNTLQYVGNNSHKYKPVRFSI